MNYRRVILLVPGLPSDPGAGAGAGAGGSAGRDERPEPMDRDVLISRVVEGRAQAGDWMHLRTLVGGDPEIWHDLALSQAQALSLQRELGAALACADEVGLPEAGSRVVHRPHDREGSDPLPYAAGRRLRAGLPWALAACLGLALFANMNATPARVNSLPGAGTQSAGLGAVLEPASAAGPATADAALADYLRLGKEQGSVVAELPQRVVVESRPAPDGKGYEVLYLRQVLERAVVNDLYRTGVDDAGRRVLLPASVPGAGGSPL